MDLGFKVFAKRR